MTRLKAFAWFPFPSFLLFPLLIHFLGASVARAGGVQGRVVDDEGAGIAGVQIRIVQVGGELGPWTVVTDGDGRYRIKDVLIFGNLDVTPSKPGFAFLPPVRSFFDPGGVDILTADFAGFNHPIVGSTRVEVQDTGAQFETTVNPLGFPTSVRFEYGPTPQLGAVTSVQSMTGNQPALVRMTVLPVPVGRTLYARAVAESSLGQRAGELGEVALPLFATHFAAAKSGPNDFVSLRVGDYDADGRMDLLWLGVREFDQLPLYHATSSLEWSPSPLCAECPSASTNIGVFSAEWIDVNHDDRLDLAVSLTEIGQSLTDATNSLRLLLGQAPGLVLGHKPEGLLLPSLRITPTELNRDGQPDFLLTSFFGTLITIANQATALRASAIVPNHSDLALADLDHDGQPDLVITSPPEAQPATVKFILGTDLPLAPVNALEELLRELPTRGVDEIAGVDSRGLRVAAADFDGDGHVDLAAIWLTEVDQQVRFYWNNGRGEFAERSSIRLPLTSTTEERILLAATGDFDNDGLADVLLACPPSTLVSAPGRHPRAQDPTGLGRGLAECRPLDADRDGRLDVVVAGGPADRQFLRVMRNTVSTVNRPPAAPQQLRAEQVGGELRLEWTSGGDDLTPSAALTWNVRVGLTPGGSEVWSALSDPVTGVRRVLRPGNAEANRFLRLRVPEGVTRLFWSVQAVDAGFLGGAWAAEQGVSLSVAGGLELTLERIEPDGTVVIQARGDGVGARLVTSDDLLTWRDLGPFQPKGPGFFEARDPHPSVGARFYGSNR